MSGHCAESVANSLQEKALRAQLCQNAAHFDSAETSPARVVTRLSDDANHVKAVRGKGKNP